MSDSRPVRQSDSLTGPTASDSVRQRPTASVRPIQRERPTAATASDSVRTARPTVSDSTRACHRTLGCLTVPDSPTARPTVVRQSASGVGLPLCAPFRCAGVKTWVQGKCPGGVRGSAPRRKNYSETRCFYTKFCCDDSNLNIGITELKRIHARNTIYFLINLLD